MSILKKWDNLYKNQKHLSIWPWSDMVSLIMRYKNPLKKKIKVLELGCGAGANIPFFLNYKCDYYSIEGSSKIVKELKKKYKIYKKNIVHGDFTKEIPFKFKFDLIIDRGSTTHNTTNNILLTLDKVEDLLKHNGIFIGTDWFSTKFSEYNNGIKLNDKYTRTNFKKGRLKNTGIAHFSDLSHIKKLFKNFVFFSLEHKEQKKYLSADKDVYAAWNLVVKKKVKRFKK